MKKYVSKLEVKWALIFVLAQLLWMVFEKMMGWHDKHIEVQEIYTNLFAVVAIAVYLFALLEKRNEWTDSPFGWKEGFFTGMSITIIVTLMAPFTQYVVNTAITPDYFENIINYSVESLGKERAEMVAMFNLKNYIMMAVIGAFVMGTITSAIIAIFTRKK